MERIKKNENIIMNPAYDHVDILLISPICCISYQLVINIDQPPKWKKCRNN